MKKSRVTKLLIGFHVVTFGAVFFRADPFPLTWVPMYSVLDGYSVVDGREVLNVAVGDKPKLKKGFEVETRSGDIDFIGPADLNIPKAAFRRIYTERAFGISPPDQIRARFKRNPISQYVFERFYPDTAKQIDWGPRIIDMLNATLERQEGDPDFIVKVTAKYEFTNMDREALRRGDLSELNSKMKISVMTKAAP